MKYPLAIFTAAATATLAMVRMVVGEPAIALDLDAASPVPPITAKQVENFAMIGGTDAEIADRFLKEESFVRSEFADVLRVTRARHKLSLRAAQFSLARKPNNSLLIWLGRNFLGQSNNPTDPGEAMPEIFED